MYHNKPNKEINRSTGDELFDYFRDNLEDMELPVSDKCWEQVSQRMADDAFAKKKRLRLFYSSVAAVLLVVLLSGVFYTVSYDKNDLILAEQFEETIDKEAVKDPSSDVQVAEEIVKEEALIAENTKSVDRPKEKTTQPKRYKNTIPAVLSSEIKAEINESETGIIGNDIVTDLALNNADVADNLEKLEGVPLVDNVGNAELAEEINTVANGRDSIESVRQKELQKLLDIYNNAQGDEILVAEHLSNDENKSKWGISTSFGSAASSSQTGRQMMSASMMEQYADNSNIVLMSKAKDDVADVDYAPPFSVGVLVSKGFGKTFALETGLVYSYLSTDYRDVVNNSYKTSMKLHYLGVPLNAVANIWRTDRFRVYASAGVMLEKGIRSKFLQEGIEVKQNVEESRSVSGVQWSVNGASGVAYRFYKGFNLYLEPRVSYYFDNDQPISIRTEKQTVFSLNTGIRYQF